MGSREENRQLIQGFNATEEVVRAAIRGSPSLCHPELDPGSALRIHPPGELDKQLRNSRLGRGEYG